MDVPHVKREDYQLTDIDDGFLVLMSDNGDLREDLKIPESDLGSQIVSEFESGKELLVRISINLFMPIWVVCVKKLYTQMTKIEVLK